MASFVYTVVDKYGHSRRQWSPCREVLLGTLREAHQLEKIICSYRVQKFPKKPMRLANEVLAQYKIPIPEHNEDYSCILINKEMFDYPEIIHAYLGVLRDGVPLNLALLKIICFLRSQHEQVAPGVVWFNGCQTNLMQYHPSLWADYFIKALIEDGKYYPQAVTRNKLIPEVSSLAINFACPEAREQLKTFARILIGDGFCDEDYNSPRGWASDQNLAILGSINYNNRWVNRSHYITQSPVTIRAYYVPDKIMNKLVYV